MSHNDRSHFAYPMLVSHQDGNHWDFYSVHFRIFGAVDFFNSYYGKNAHRRTSGFQNLKTQWNLVDSKQKNKFQRIFVLWMDQEAKTPNYKPVVFNDLPIKEDSALAAARRLLEKDTEN